MLILGKRDYLSEIDALFEDSVDPETGEIINPAFEEELAKLMQDRDVGLEQIALLYKDTKSELVALKEAEKDVQKKMASAERRMEFCKNFLTIQLNGEKFGTALVSVYYQTTSSVDIQDESAIPAEYIKTVSTPMKTEIKKAIQAGKEVPGCVIMKTTSTVIR